MPKHPAVAGSLGRSLPTSAPARRPHDRSVICARSSPCRVGVPDDLTPPALLAAIRSAVPRVTHFGPMPDRTHHRSDNFRRDVEPVGCRL